MAADTEVMPKFAVATWTCAGALPIPIAVVSVTKEIENGLVKQRRPYRKGAKLDNMSRETIVWTIEAWFFNGCEEEGIPYTGYYPAYLNALEASIEVEQTGTLTIGRDGPKRGQLKHLRTAETADQRDCAVVQITFWEDTEDTTTSATFAPTATSEVPVLADVVGELSLDTGVWSDDVIAFGEAMGSLATVISTPDDLLADALATAGRVIQLAQLIEDEFSIFYDQSVPDGARLALDPDAAPLVMALRRSQDRAARARATLLERVPTRAPVTFGTVVSIFQVAAQYNQDIEDLISMNTGNLDPGTFYAIPIGHPVTIDPSRTSASTT